MSIEIQVPDIGADEVEVTEVMVKVGDKVKAGQVLAEVGLTGCTTGTHAHITVSKNRAGANPIDPTTLVGRSW